MKWTEEKIIKEAKKYKTRGEFRAQSKSAYNAAISNGILDRVCSHMKPKYRKWSKKSIQFEASKFKTRTEFARNSSAAYTAAQTRGILDQVCSHMKSIQKPFDHWTKDNLANEALKYKTRKEFQDQAKGAYWKAQQTGLLDEICSHMIIKKRSKDYWTLSRLKNEALKYKTRGEFQKKSIAAYSFAHKHSLLDKICKHMNKAGSRYLRRIYAIEFFDNSVYVGLTSNFKNRHDQHLKADTKVGNKMRTEEYNFKKFNKFYELDKIGIAEEKKIKHYIRDGWKILNKAKAGSIGTPISKYSEEQIRREAKKYKSRSEFQKKANKHYQAAKRRKILEKVCSHMDFVYKKWTKTELIKIAKNYDTKKEFYRYEPKAYSFALRKGLIEEVCSHMTSKTMWSKDLIMEKLKDYEYLIDFRKDFPAGYAAARRLKILDVVKGKLKLKNKQWRTKKEVKREASNYKNKTTFEKKAKGAYRAAVRMGILETLFSSKNKK